MHTIHLIGLTGSIIIGISFIPQTIKIITDNDVTSISLSFVIINIISAILMMIYGIELDILPIIIANTSVLVNNLIILLYIIKNTY
jgi:MtN3 and saliva related transmembrane protein